VLKVVLKPNDLDEPPGPYMLVAEKTSGLSWSMAETICNSNGMDLCPYKLLCYNGDKAKNKFYTANADTWIPYGGDGTNGWITVGNAHPFCQTHQQIAGGRPGWGNNEDRGPHKGPLYCCGNKPKISSEVHIPAWSYDQSWKDSENICAANGMELCNYLSICPKGPNGRPWGGIVTSGNPGADAWSPVGGEEDNMWIQVGKAWPTCLRHTSIQNGAHGRPGWGLVRDRGAHHGPIYCCGKEKKLDAHVMSIGTSNMAWDDVNEMCQLNQMSLCNFDSLCPNGRGNDPVMGRQGSDIWIPMQDNTGSDTWVQIGRPWPACFRHSEVPGGFGGAPYGRPGWGDNRSNYGFKGPAYCCGKKPAPRTMENIGSSKGKNWDGANAACQAKKKGLCRFTDFCPDGPGSTPSIGAKGGDVWVPFADAGSNSWLQVGGGGWPLCNRHSDIANGIHGRPGWGLAAGGEAYRGDIFCC